MDHVFTNNRTGSRLRPAFESVGLMLAALATFISPCIEATAQVPSMPPAARDEAAVAARADALLARMTSAEKAGQLTQLFNIPNVAPIITMMKTAVARGEAGALLFVTDPLETNELQKIAVEQSRMKIPLLFGFDVIHGLHTIFPVPLAIAASWDPGLAESVQSVAANEARAVGLHWTFAPNVDVARDPRWGRIVEGAGEDPYLGSAMAAAQVRGFQGPFLGSPGRIIAGPKHFAGYGAAMGGRDYDEVNLSENELWNVYLPPFKAAVDAGAGNIMSAYMGLNGVPASGNRWLLTKVLRDTWGFKGFVVSDNGAVLALKTHGVAADDGAAAALALRAGLDMEMVPPPGAGGAMRSLRAAVQGNRVSQAEVNTAVRRVLAAKIRMGLFESPYVDVSKVATIHDDPAHRKLAAVAAERSVVLLRNEQDMLPLDRRKLKSIAVIGPLAVSERDTLGSWVFAANKPQVVTVLSGLREKVGQSMRIDYSEGVRMPQRLHPSPLDGFGPKFPAKPPIDESREFQRAVDLARGADVAILVLGESQLMSGEFASRSSLDLPGRQQELLEAVVATGKPVVLLLMSARPMDLKGIAPAAIMNIWYPGTEGGSAVANLLFGDATPGGKLPYTWIRNASQAPMIYSHLISHEPAGVSRRYWNESNKPSYPFGFGLSYTRFAYSNLRAEKPAYAPGETVTVMVDVKNVGDRKGEEVAQLYIHQQLGTSARPVRELKGFKREALKPGETRTLRFMLSPNDLCYWSAVTGDWAQDESRFDVWVGGSSDADLAATFEVKK